MTNETKQIMATCSCPGCDRPGNNQCSACKNKLYCGPNCQTADWPNHREECPGHLLKLASANLIKAMRFRDENNRSQLLHHAHLAATKLKQWKDHPVELTDHALSLKFKGLNMMGRYREALDCAKEWYCLHLTKHTHPPAIIAGFAVIESCIKNGEYFDAVLYARTTWETITIIDSHIPDNKREEFTAEGAYHLAKALKSFAGSGKMPAKEKQEAGVEAITLVRRALEIHTRLHGRESVSVADDMGVLAQALETFSDYGDDEALRLYEQSITIFTRVHGMSGNVANCEACLGEAYSHRARQAFAAVDLLRCTANLEQCLSHYREAIRIYRAVNRGEQADRIAKEDLPCEEEKLRVVTMLRALGAAATRV